MRRSPTACRFLPLALLAAATALCLLSSLVYQRGAFLYSIEADRFLVHYLADRGIIGKCLDVALNDWTNYQGRELSYIFDCLDARVIAVSTALRLPHFYSFTYYAALAFIAAMFVDISRRRLKLDHATIGLLLAVFLTSPTIFFSGFFYRSAKVLVALFLTAAIWALARRSARAWPLPAAMLLLGLADMQGRLLAFALTAGLAVSCVVRRSEADRPALRAALAAAAAAVAYLYLVGPALIKAVNGYEVDLHYLDLPWKEYFSHFLLYLTRGGALFVDTFRFFTGNLARMPAVILFGAGCLAVVAGAPDGPENAPRARLERASILAIWLAAFVAMFSVMLLRLPNIALPSLRRVIFWTPAAVSILFFAASAASSALKRGLPRRAVWLTLGAMLAANVSALAGHERVIRAGVFKDDYERAPALLEGLRRLDDASFTPDPTASLSRFYRLMRDKNPQSPEWTEERAKLLRRRAGSQIRTF